MKGRSEAETRLPVSGQGNSYKEKQVRRAMRAYYNQVADQIRARILNGELRPGDRLPSMRALAGKLRVSSAIVQHAYRELQRDGLIESFAGRGCFVSVGGKAFYQKQMRRVEKSLYAAAEIGKSCGIPLDVLEETLIRFYQKDVQGNG